MPGYANVCFEQDQENIPADFYLVFDLLFELTHESVSLLKPFLLRSFLAMLLQTCGHPLNNLLYASLRGPLV